MKKKKPDSASFVLRFTPKVFENEKGEPDIQWRGTIQHVQDGEEQRFSDFEKAVNFMHEKLSDLTIDLVNSKSEEAEQNLLSKGFNLWKQLAIDTPKSMVDSFLDPKKRMENIQNQLSQVGDMINAKKPDFASSKKLAEELRFASKADFKVLVELYAQMSKDLATLTEKVEDLHDKL